MSVLSREALLTAASQPLPRETTIVPALGGEVIVQGLSGAQRDEWETSLSRGARRGLNTANLRARLVVRCVVNEAGDRLLTDEDAAALGHLRADVLDVIFGVAQRLSGLGQMDLETLKKIFGDMAGSDSPTSSPSASGG